MPKRLQSPSSINTYKQCPRKYYYNYIQKLPTKPTIHLVRGKITHSVLEDFFDIDLTGISLVNYKEELPKRIQQLFLKEWTKNQSEIRKFTTTMDQERFYFSETLLMLLNWINHFIKTVESFPNLSFPEIFRKLTPLREKQYISYDFYVQGFIDAIEHHEDEVHIIDYKTNTNLEISEEQRLQLAIYALLYRETHGRMPDKAGIFFLRSRLKHIAVSQELLDEAEREIQLIHENTQSGNIDDYPLKPGPLCNYCDFYGICFKQKTITDYGTGVQTIEPEQRFQE
ncbi:PD-(D/E)XK nuclease family protein [Candidatus Woesearchaeota archaeon]|nr:PD-(D/E)XK nuclease family protein [Candidatus Woesearchaeota archaeon]